ncbi:V-type ATP synthase subunit D [Merdibacter massiliensis]|uniref:V-type ATP synthase subunit D n=1 Tax=Merdibacter massiliensis TaxID=1871030 RepID=UPI00096A4786|nr:V-type ATP synthase subunit D [Merdibacter massiliensis]
MANKQVFPTKGNLIASKKSNSLAKMGYELMDRKRNILTREMMELVEDVRMLREKITDTYQRAYQALQEANMTQGVISDLAEAIPIDNGIQVTYHSVMGVEIPKLHYEQEDMVFCYGMEKTNSKLDYAYQCFHEVKQLTITLVEVENGVYRLANAIRKSQKRANALKNIVIPGFEHDIKFITEALEEKEREEFSRQKVIKNTKLKQQKADV